MKPSILTLVHYYLPGYKSGGPIRTIANMVERLGDEFQFRIVTADRDATDDVPYPAVRVNEWNRVGKAEVFYCAPRTRSVGFYRSLVRNVQHDLVYLNSYFDLEFTVLPLLARRFGHGSTAPVIIAPRGEFSPGALRLKRWKKTPYRYAAGAIGLYSGLVWQASSEFEAEEIRAAMGPVAQRIVVAPNLASVPEVPRVTVRDRRRAKDRLSVLFLSRITPKKNLAYALKVLSLVREPVSLSIVGPVRDEAYWEQCREFMARLPPHVTATYVGSVEHSDVARMMSEHDLFFLPTLGENYGHVIAEALAVGTPVLISDRTPWRDLERAGVGWDLPLTDEGAFAERIDWCARLDAPRYEAWRERVRQYAQDRFNDNDVVEANRRLFLDVVLADKR